LDSDYLVADHCVETGIRLDGHPRATGFGATSVEEGSPIERQFENNIDYLGVQNLNGIADQAC
jgi:hypothetical protein